MADTNPGCLLFGLPALLLGRRRPALPGGATLPVLQTATIHRQDLPAMVRARRAAEGCMQALVRREDEVSQGVVADVAARIASLLQTVYAAGARLAEARRFLEAHAPERVARERAELELEMIGASSERLRAQKQAMAALERRASAVEGVQRDLETLEARLEAAVAELQELETRAAAEVGSDDLLHELRAHQQAAELALDAFNETLAGLEEA